jgi:hypothetical protein
MSKIHSGNIQPSIDYEEHDHKNVDVKKVGIFGYDPGTDSYNRIGTDSDGQIPTKTGIFSKPYDEILITYADSSKQVITQIETKLSGVLQETITVTSPSAVQDDYVRS